MSKKIDGRLHGMNVFLDTKLLEWLCSLSDPLSFLAHGTCRHIVSCAFLHSALPATLLIQRPSSPLASSRLQLRFSASTYACSSLLF